MLLNHLNFGPTYSGEYTHAPQSWHAQHTHKLLAICIFSIGFAPHFIEIWDSWLFLCVRVVVVVVVAVVVVQLL